LIATDEAKPLAPTASSATPSVTTIQRSRVLPKLSFRVLLTIVTVTAVVAFAARLANAGSPLATALVFVVGLLAGLFALFAILFLIAWVPAIIGRDRWEDVHKGNPFAADQLPPQVLPPREPGT
jgi:RsiW-degrading membrane proteinase PrsW (M82 family)